MYKTNNKNNKQLSPAEKTFFCLAEGFIESVKGVFDLRFDFLGFSIFALIMTILFVIDLDILIMHKIGLLPIYASSEAFFWTIYFTILFFRFTYWGVKESRHIKRYLKNIDTSFRNSKLVNAAGETPIFIDDYELDEDNRKFIVNANGVPYGSFLKQKEDLESAFKIYIDEIKENRSSGLVEIFYSLYPMHEKVELDILNLPANHKYPIGNTRSKSIVGDFKSSPHLLLAGQTGGGKSTFLKQMVTSLYLKNKNATFTVIDLKGGLEFQIFENLPRASVIEDVNEVSASLEIAEKELDRRMKLLKESQCKDIDAYIEKKLQDSSQKIKFDRKYILIDEVAELAAKQGLLKPNEVLKIKVALSRIARLGRACGIHLVLSTQRPDIKTVASQVKSNLTSIICFPMPNLATSMTVLSNGRAEKLPSVKGRAIYKEGGTILEVQTPFLSDEQIDNLLEPYRKVKGVNSNQNDNDSTNLSYKASVDL